MPVRIVSANALAHASAQRTVSISCIMLRSNIARLADSVLAQATRSLLYFAALAFVGSRLGGRASLESHAIAKAGKSC